MRVRSLNYLCVVILASCVMKDPDPLFLSSTTADSYPSGSTISYLNERFYIMGDDASELLVLNKDLYEEERISMFQKGPEIRAPKLLKADIESSVVIDFEKKPAILFLGSGSVSPHRDSAFLLEPENKQVRRWDMTNFYDRLRAEFKDLNIEAAARIGSELLLGIRGNTTFRDNYIALAQLNGSVISYKSKCKLNIDIENAGISGMDYDEPEDILLITFSSEDTPNSFDDGEIGESFLAIISNARQSLKKDTLTINRMIKLSDLSPEFNSQKIESVSITANTRELLLVADDDKGNTRLFKISF
ncbi:MAG: hypothetical protein WKF68_06430 [Daejeonella sp.]